MVHNGGTAAQTNYCVPLHQSSTSFCKPAPKGRDIDKVVDMTPGFKYKGKPQNLKELRARQNPLTVKNLIFAYSANPSPLKLQNRFSSPPNP